MRWTEKEIGILKEMYPNNPTRVIAEKLGRTVMAVRTYAGRIGIRKGPEYNRMLNSVSAVPQQARDFIRDNYNKYTNIELAQITGVSKSTVQAVRRQYGLKKEVNTGCFQKGHAPHNKGKKVHEYASPEAIERMRGTQFKKGDLPHNTRKNGDISVRRDKSGREYYYMRVSLGKWELLHRLIYEKHHGPIPDGMAVRFRDGDTSNLSLANLELISLQENAVRNQNWKKAIGTMMENETHPSRHLTDNYLAGILARGDEELKELLLKKDELLRVYRSNLKLRRKIKQNEKDSR